MPEFFANRRLPRSSLLSLALSLLVACSSNSRAPVEDRNARAPAKPAVQSVSSSRDYRVQRGDTLYSIAFRYGLDYRKVASANNIPSPYTIYVGQKLVLSEAALPAVSSVPAAPKKSTRPAASKTPSSAPKTQPTSRPISKPASAAPNSKSFTGKKVSTWRWPASGKVTRGYSGSVHKGIDIGGERGEPVVAVAAGKVVYAGTGIVGFGELIIVKHNEVYLSAYGHNDSLLVAEGQVVTAGERIATKGSTGTDTVKLHFEIRKEGKPIDPLRLLPRR